MCSLCGSRRDRRVVALLKYTQSTRTCPLIEAHSPGRKTHQSLLPQQKGHLESPLRPAFLYHLRMGKKTSETFVKVTTQGHRPPRRLRSNHMIIECFPPRHHDHFSKAQQQISDSVGVLREAERQHGRQKQGHWVNLASASIANIKYSLTPSQINIKPHTKGLYPISYYFPIQHA